jgi:hypothetical protein
MGKPVEKPKPKFKTPEQMAEWRAYYEKMGVIQPKAVSA